MLQMTATVVPTPTEGTEMNLNDIAPHTHSFRAVPGAGWRCTGCDRRTVSPPPTELRASYQARVKAERVANAKRFVELFHMCDWSNAAQREELAGVLGLQADWNTHAAYLEAREIAGMAS